MSNRKNTFVGLLLTLGFATSQAGVIYTDEAAFNLAVTTMSNVWSEDFEGFAPGQVADPLTIGGGGGEVLDGEHAYIFTGSLTGQTWRQAGLTQAHAKIRGVGDSALGVNALSFLFANQQAGAWEFVGSEGLDSSAVFAAGEDTERTFIGWIGTGGETLDRLSFTAMEGTLLDNIGAYNGDPDPDSDGDAVPDSTDNCTAASNPLQVDADLDGIGNLCDADLTNDCAVTFEDLGLMKQQIFGNDPVADLNVDGAVNFIDLGLMKEAFFAPPGPSASPNLCDS